ncbi:DNA-binding transcriptional MerR regulator [Nakamurella sp. UYEF19]|uniref:MerR family transcriptional regulator n=1 Tax=Nakamurella sp. UYEF19 TaxID=1756392 RepID=UPI003394068E
MTSYSVGQVADLAGVTVRTLHHYGRIGLLEPEDRSGAGYRQYSDADLDRLQHILFYRELGFSLEEISNILTDPGATTGAHLRKQHELLNKRIDRLREMIAAVEKEMEAHTMGIQLTPKEKFEIFGQNYSEDYETEAEQRWGDTEAWKQSQSRTATFSKEDWVRIKAEGDDLNRRLGAALGSGTSPDSVTAMDLAEEHHASIEVFYECPYAAHRGIGDMYVADPRFTKTYDDVAPGLAQWLRDAIHANADRHEG